MKDLYAIRCLETTAQFRCGYCKTWFSLEYERLLKLDLDYIYCPACAAAQKWRDLDGENNEFEP